MESDDKKYIKELENKLIKVVIDRENILNAYKELKDRVLELDILFQRHTASLIDDIDTQDKEMNDMFIGMDELEKKYEDIAYELVTTRSEKNEIESNYKDLLSEHNQLKNEHSEVKIKVSRLLSNITRGGGGGGGGDSVAKQQQQQQQK
ncbi:hypothetical protein SAMD00019534_016620 [Acytostelium subglobosum LB1]|uniref:hypothetical protein n=1 Tax=Acytostelium subglobosum LB1 TaxID=1410327 RepID=UPI000644A09C|nr:hypothetical protein SAMD00019534_016620 [Acytostelium subglobosum LB1]GAM18487.1 hypothetical protein SAMD00019534_016620 [Acytostelium subglobosum LB1]|eukprot:XP_012757707.1 hypothetical protein SAMD00019534_016620 [Acytostelium subglobosum LB1]